MAIFHQGVNLVSKSGPSLVAYDPAFFEKRDFRQTSPKPPSSAPIINTAYPTSSPCETSPRIPRRDKRCGAPKATRFASATIVEHEPWLIANRVRGLPVHHGLVHPPSVEVGAEWRRKLVDVGVHLFVFGSAPPKAAVLVFRVTVL